MSDEGVISDTASKMYTTYQENEIYSLIFKLGLNSKIHFAVTVCTLTSAAFRSRLSTIPNHFCGETSQLGEGEKRGRFSVCPSSSFF